MLKKALKDELASLAKRAFGQGLWESAQALGALATGNMTSATAHGIAAGAYFALAGTAGVAAKNMSSVVPHKPSETGASSASVAGASTSGGGQIINFYFPNGFVYGDKDTIARVVTESVASAKARGKM